MYRDWLWLVSLEGEVKVYIAARLSQRPELHTIRAQLWELGHEVVSTWSDEGGDYAVAYGGDKAAKIA